MGWDNNNGTCLQQVGCNARCLGGLVGGVGVKRGDAMGWVARNGMVDEIQGCLRAAQLTPGTWNDLASD